VSGDFFIFMKGGMALNVKMLLSNLKFIV
jgi:hypothetical protein